MSRSTEVFSVGTDFVQVVTRGARPRRISVGDRSVVADGPVAATTIGGLTPATRYSIKVDASRTVAATTLPRPGGELLARIATVSDNHVGEHRFGRFPTIASVPSRQHFADAHPVWGLRAAAGEIGDWRPDALAVKGDLSHRDTPAEFELAIGILKTVGAPLIGIRGNHDGGNYLHCKTVAVAAELGLTFSEGVTVHHVRNAKVVTVESAVVGRSRGSVAAHIDGVSAALDDDMPTLVLLHHQLMRWPVPTYIPVGIRKREADPFLGAISAASRRLLVSSGHTHRHRLRYFNGVPVTEVGSTKDYPGVWAGYELYEGGIVQTVRRIADPQVLAWTDSTKRVMLHTWGLWSPGRLDQRCFTHTW